MTEDETPLPAPAPRPRRPLWPLAVGGVVAGVIAVILLLPILQPYTFHGAILQADSPAPAINLTTTEGEPLDLAAYEGSVVVLYFGYTFCPDVCPTTLADVARAKRDLGSEDIQVIMVTVDPARDTPDVLDNYLTSFDPTFLGAYGPEELIAEAAALYGVYFEAREGSEATGYLVDHTATLMVIDTEGRLKLLLPFGVSADDIAADLNALLN